MQNHAKKRFDNTNVNVMAAIAIGAMLIFPLAGMKAFADVVINDVVVNDKTVSIIAGEKTTVRYQIIVGDNRTPEGDRPGCNANSPNPVRVTINAPSGVTSTPSSLTFTACDVWQSVEFTSDNSGDYQITIDATGGRTGSSYDESPATFTLAVDEQATDTTPPELNLPADITQEATSASGADVTYTASATDDVDGSVDVTCTPESGSTFALGSTTVNCEAQDTAGNQATGSFSVTIQDKTAPTLELPADITQEATSASGADVTYTASANDNIDGPITPECTPASGSTFPLGTTPVNCSATDNAGNQATGSFNVIVQDTTKPVIQVTSTISNGQEFYFGDVPSAPTCSATDTGSSGVNSDGCKVSGYSTAVGSYTLIFTATDNAGNTASQQITYKVLAWTIKGFYQPVDMNGVLNTVKGGSTVPLKFEVFKGGTELTDTSAIKTPLTAKKVNCDSGTTLDEIETVASGSTALRYDSTAGQFIYNWQTPKQPNACYDVTVGTQDSSSILGEFRLR
jgi:HYR domain